MEHLDFYDLPVRSVKSTKNISNFTHGAVTDMAVHLADIYFLGSLLLML